VQPAIVSPNELPLSAAWRHQGARDGFEVAYIRQMPRGDRLQGYTTAVEAGQSWVVGYRITVDESWRTRTAHVWTDSTAGLRQARLESDTAGTWTLDGSVVLHLQGCLDVDLESSACTNTLPIHRLRLEAGTLADAPAAYVRVAGLAIERREQSYLMVSSDEAHDQYAHAAPIFDFECRLVYDNAGLLLDYPGLAQRVF
jgi:hypothetical protein